MLKRSAYQGYVSGWSEVPYHDCPSFGLSRSLLWNPLSQAHTFDSSSPYKLAFSFNQHEQLTPFILVNDGASTFLHSLTFTFLYQHGSIVAFHYDSEYEQQSGEDKGSVDYSIHVHYVWVEQSELSSVFGMETMMIVWLALIWMMMIFITLRACRGESSSSTRRGAGIDNDRQRLSQMLHTKGV